jgi:cytochrome bd-type quinol oxidase subunit 2
MDWRDIALHTLPTMAVAVACAWMTDFGLRSATWWEAAIVWILPAVVFLCWFTAMWQAREKRQHGGFIPTRQSRLEAYMPLLAIPVYFVSTFAFRNLNL